MARSPRCAASSELAMDFDSIAGDVCPFLSFARAQLLLLFFLVYRASIRVSWRRRANESLARFVTGTGPPYGGVCVLIGVF